MSFKRGDKVIIPSKPDRVLSSEPDWVPTMDDYIGKEGSIINVEDKCIRVQFEDGLRWWYSLRWFEIDNFKIGDKVRIKSNSKDLFYGYVCSMEEYDGQTGVIIDHNSSDDTYKVRFDDEKTWWYSTICFESPNNDLKVNNLELNNLELLLI